MDEITRTEYEARNREIRETIRNLADKVDGIEKDISSLSDKIGSLKIDTWKMLSFSAVNFIIGSGVTVFFENLMKK